MPIISSFPDFHLSLEATEFGFKSEFFLRITHLHKIAHTWVEFKSKIEPINSILRVLWLKTFRTIIFDHTVGGHVGSHLGSHVASHVASPVGCHVGSHVL